MATRLKSNIAYQPIVEEVSRKFVPKKETCTAGKQAGPVVTLSNGWMGGAVRNTYRGVLGKCTRNYLVVRSNARMTQPSVDELKARANFASVVRGRNFIMADLAQITRVETMFVAASKDATKTCNGISALGYTVKGWVFAVQYAGLDNDPEYNVNTFPQSFDA